MPAESEAFAAESALPIGQGAGRAVRITIVGTVYLGLAALAGGAVSGLSGSYPLGVPAGFALAALLIYGMQCWPGLWLAAVLATHLFAHAGASFALSVCVATGGVGQAVVGAYLVRNLVYRARPLTREWDVFRFLVLGGVVASTISASVATAAHVQLGWAGTSAAIGIWIQWWAFDAIGVLLCVPPLLFLWPNTRLFSLAQGARIVLPSLLVALVMLAGYVGLQNGMAERDRADGYRQSADIFDAWSLNIPGQLQRLQGLERLFAASEYVSRREFDIFARAIVDGTSIGEVYWAPRVMAADLEGHVADLRKSGLPDYVVQELGGDGRLRPVSSRDDYFPVVYARQTEPADSILGLDYGADEARRKVMARASGRGSPQAMEQAVWGRGHLAVFVYVPVYQRDFDYAVANPVKRYQALRGFVVGAFAIRELVAPLLKKAREHQFEVRVIAVSPENDKTPLLDTLAQETAPLWQRQLLVGGQVWRAQMSPATASIAVWHKVQGQIYLAICVFVALLVSFATLGGAGRNIAAAALVAERTAALTAANHELKTQRNRLAQEVQVRRRAETMAEAANRAKSAFLATMSHEIRTPMNGVVGMAEVLRKSRLTSHQRELVETMTRSAHSLLTLIDDILDFSKIEAGRLDLDLGPVDLAELVEEICDALVPVAYNKNVLLTKFVAPELPSAVLADPTRLRQIVNNLISNAIKFSAGREEVEGQVVVRVELMRDDPLRVVISVADNGIGIDAEHQSKLFTPFTQAEASTTRRFGGTGLGLAICRRLVDMMHGDIQVANTPDRGATFTVTMDFERAADLPQRMLANVAGVHCLIVPGPGFPVQDLQAYLSHGGAQVEVVQDLRAAADRAATLEQCVVIHDAEGQVPDRSVLDSLFEETPNVRHVALTRGRRRKPRMMGDDTITVDLERMRRATLLEAVAAVSGRVSTSPYVLRMEPGSESRAGPADGSEASDLAGVECIVVVTPELDVDELVTKLTGAGARVHTASTLEAAAELARRLAGHPVVVHDACGPRVSFDRLQGLFSRVANVRHLAVTRGQRGHARIEVQEAVTLDSGALKSEAFIDAVAVAAGRASPALLDPGEDAGGELGTAPDIDEVRRQGRLILVAEDDSTNRKVIRTQLRSLGHAAEIAQDGEQALTMWRSGSYALVLTDLHMPKMDGHELVRAIRREEGGERRIPILALTANTLRGEDERALAEGMDGYLTKPIELDVLNQALQQWMPSAPQASTESASAQQVTGLAPAAATATVDLDVLKRLVGDDPETVQELLEDFSRTLASRKQQIYEAVAGDDCGRLVMAAHALKSASRSVGALTLGELCAQLESAGKAEDWTVINQLMNDFSIQLGAVADHLAALVQEGKYDAG